MMRQLMVMGALAGVLFFNGPRVEERAAPAAAPSIGAFVLHFDPEFAAELTPLHSRLLESLPSGVAVYVAVPDGRVREEFLDFVGRDLIAGSSVEFITTDSPLLSPWARDRYVIADRGAGPVVVLPLAESVAGERLADLEIGERLAIRLDLPLIRSDLDFEGGNVVIHDDGVVVGHGLIEANVARGLSEAEVRSRLRKAFGRRPVVVGNASRPTPHEHVDMYLAVVGWRQAIVGDPRLAEPWFDALRDLGVDLAEVPLLGAMDRGLGYDLCDLYDGVAADLADQSYSVRRIPVIHTASGGVITWTNSVTGTTAGDPRPRAWVPDYGIPILDRAAQRVWTDLGFAVEPVPCQSIAPYGGALRCVTNVVPTISEH